MSRILELLALRPADESVDYVTDKTQFHLHGLLTEQRHPATWDLGAKAATDLEAALGAILAVDADIERRCAELAADPEPLARLADAVVAAVQGGRRVYVYGCGATGRLAKQLESSFWRPFWRRLRAGPHGGAFPAGIEDALVGEMTGGDRALVSSLEGFEDLQRLGALQLEDHGIARGDVVVCVTEGGETSSVIGTVLAARRQYGPGEADAARANVWFVYNNPDAVLRPFERSRAVLDEPGITKLCLATGPQAIAGSTRMQATSSETFVLGLVLEAAIGRLLAERLPEPAVRALGFRPGTSVAATLGDFAAMRAALAGAVPSLAHLTGLEAATYEAGAFATYLAGAAMVTVFTDCTERSPTFRLWPLDPVDLPERRCWVQTWTMAQGGPNAWHDFLGRPFRGLDAGFYGPPLRAEITDPYLRRAALDSLANAGADQEARYDFAFPAADAGRRGPRAGDLGVLVLAGGECRDLDREGSDARRFAALCRDRGARLAVIRVGAPADLGPPPAADACVTLALDLPDPLGVRQHVALKILLNAHSTATFARLGRVVGNTMTNVSPSNLKLIGRATFLVQSHVDDTLRQPEWRAAHGPAEPLSFADANAVLFDAIAWVRQQRMGQTAEVALCIVRVLEALARGAAPSWQEAHAILEREGLGAYLQRHNPALDPARRAGGR